MAKVKNLGLYIGILCAIGIMAIFFFDAYIGIYDTLYVTGDGWDVEITFDRPYPEFGTEYGEAIYFTYAVTNNMFEEYDTYIEASVWRGYEKNLTLFSANESIKPFDNTTVKWVQACPTYHRLSAQKFSAWLKQKYGSHAALEQAWGQVAAPISITSTV